VTFVLLLDERAEPVQQELLVVTLEHELLAQDRYHLPVGAHRDAVIVDDAQQREQHRVHDVAAGQYVVDEGRPRGHGAHGVRDHRPRGRQPLERAARPGRRDPGRGHRPRGRAERVRHERHGHDGGVRAGRAVHAPGEAVVDHAREPLDVEHNDQRDEAQGRHQRHVETAQPDDGLHVDHVQHVFGQVQLLLAHGLEQAVLAVPDQYAPGAADQHGDGDLARDVHDQQPVHDLAHVRLPAQRRAAQRAGALRLLARAVGQPVRRAEQRGQQRQFHACGPQHAQPGLLARGPFLEPGQRVEHGRQRDAVERDGDGRGELDDERPRKRLLVLQ